MVTNIDSSVTNESKKITAPAVVIASAARPIGSAAAASDPKTSINTAKSNGKPRLSASETSFKGFVKARPKCALTQKVEFDFASGGRVAKTAVQSFRNVLGLILAYVCL